MKSKKTAKTSAKENQLPLHPNTTRVTVEIGGKVSTIELTRDQGWRLAIYAKHRDEPMAQTLGAFIDFVTADGDMEMPPAVCEMQCASEELRKGFSLS